MTGQPATTRDNAVEKVGAALEQGASAEQDKLAALLGELLERARLGALDRHSLTRLTGGASQQSWAFVAADAAAERRAYVLRRLPEDAPLLDNAIGPECEAAAIAAAKRAGVPVPAVRHVLVPSDGLGRGFISERVEGETIPRRIQRDPAFSEVRPRLAAECGAILARLHQADMRSVAGPPHLPPRAKLERLRSLYRRLAVRRPVFEAAFRWLEDNMPTHDATRGPALVHGDFRLGNLIIDANGVAAVLDWEMAHIGDPAEDLGWLTVNSWRFGNRSLPVGGLGTEADLLAGYIREGGVEIAPGDLAFWRIFGSLNWGIGCIEMSLPQGPDVLPSIERAMIGRRSSEAEIDILDELLVLQ